MAEVINRKMAGKLLKVSLRTIDRYIRQGKLLAKEENGRIWLDRKEVMNFPRLKGIHRKLVIDQRSVVALSTQGTQNSMQEFYRDLYGEAKKALEEYQIKLEQANYRIGQLESLRMESNDRQLPKMERESDMFYKEFMKKELADREKELSLLKDLLKQEKNSRIVFAIITYTLLILLPLVWYLSG